MTELVTAAEMRAIEADAIASGAVSGLRLMEIAGQGVVDAILQWRPDLAQGAPSATVLCGPGNNGGDGYVVARLLAERGWTVRVQGMGAAATMPPDAQVNRLRWEAAGRVQVLKEQVFRDGPASDIYIDAIFGTGLKRAPEGDLLSLLRYLGGADPDEALFASRLVAIDAPSGLDLDSGRMLAAGRAEPGASTVPICSLTVTFEVPKLGHFLADGPACCGRLAVVDLGLAKWRGLRRDAITGEVTGPGQPTIPRARLIDRVPLVAPALPGGHRTPDFAKRPGHKYDHGHVLVVSGPAERTGAARLAARAALRVGAGLVTVASPANALLENALHLTAIMTRRCVGAEGLAQILEDARFTSVCMGPGMGVGGSTCAMALAAVSARRHVVLDADALTSFSDAPDRLFEAIHAARDTGDGNGHGVVLTPHGGEFGRLFPDLAPSRSLSKVEAVRAAARRSGAVVLLKGPDTVIATSSGSASIHCAAYDRTTPWLATAGAGDVLAGLITGLAAQSSVLQFAVEDATWLHVEAARALGPGLIAEDLPEVLPKVFRDLGL